ncbi:MAG: stage III sporulation protein AB [Lachnospiraceae bacterium]|nr:stage III sporulation protein AB [Lachnospiraceae bacterium]
MRETGILIMSGTVIVWGFYAAEKWKERLKVLLLFSRIVCCLKSRILYANSALPEALAEAGLQYSGERSGNLAEPGAFFRRVSERMEKEKDRPFSELWKEEIEKLPQDLPMGRADRQNLAELGEALGYADRGMQEKTLDFYLEQTDESAKRLKAECADRVKLYRALGMAAGLFILVVLA